MDLHISRLLSQHVTLQLVDELNVLIRQLSQTANALTEEVLLQIAQQDSVIVLIARHVDGAMVGMATLSTSYHMTGIRSHVEDVVIDNKYRGKGYGKHLLKTLLEHAPKQGTIDLTSRPERHSANQLYQSLGFTQRMTNVYRFVGH